MPPKTSSVRLAIPAFVAGVVCLLASAARADVGAELAAMADTPFVPVARALDPPLTIMPRVFAADRSGFLWAGGANGLLRWDGYTVQTYEDGSADGLPDHQIMALHAAPDGTLWVGTALGGLARLRPGRDRFDPVPLGQARHVAGIADDGSGGGLLVATGSGLFRLDPQGRVIAHISHDQRPDSLPDDRTEAVLRDRNGTIWVGGPSGLARSVRGGAAFAPVSLGSGAPDTSALLQDGLGRIWIGTHDGAFVLSGGSIRRIDMPGGPGAAHEIMAMAEMAPGEVWLGTYGKGILAVSGPALATRRIAHDSGTPDGLDSDAVFGLGRDRSGLPWVSTPPGISHAQASPGIHTLFGHVAASEGLAVEEPTALLARADGSLWIGSESNGVEILDPSGRAVRRIPVQPIVAMAEGPDGRVFAGGRGGAWILGANGAIERLTVPGRDPAATVWSLAERGGALLLGGDDGFWQLRVPPGGPVQVLRRLAPPILPDPSVLTIAEAPGGRTALGTGNGLALVDLRSGQVERVVADRNDPFSLPPGTVSCLTTDARGRLWVGTGNSGLYVLTGRDPSGRRHFTRIGTPEGLPNNGIDRLVEAGRRMWVATDGGLAAVDLDDFSVASWTRADGIAVGSYWLNAGAATRSGDLLFGGVGGVTVVEPDRVGEWRYRPPVVATGLHLNGRPVPWNGGPIHLRPKTRSFAVEFAALDLSAPDHNRYRYRLDGFDQTWIDTDAAHRVATYTNLPPGRYRLQLEGSNRLGLRRGLWSSAPPIDVTVTPAWFQSVWFGIAETLSILAILAGLIQARTALLRHRQRELERQIAERTAELRASREQFKRLAYFDALTALPNRRAFDDEFRAACDRAGEGTPFVLGLVDLDQFKRVNDAIGHQGGDEMLSIAAARLRGSLRDTDFVCRLGGDEFALLFRGDCGRAAVERICARIVSALAEPILVGGTVVTSGATIGIVPFHPGESPHELYKHADTALYAAKRAGRGAWRWFEEEEPVSPAPAEPVPV